MVWQKIRIWPKDLTLRTQLKSPIKALKRCRLQRCNQPFSFSDQVYSAERAWSWGRDTTSLLSWRWVEATFGATQCRYSHRYGKTAAKIRSYLGWQDGLGLLSFQKGINFRLKAFEYSSRTFSRINKHILISTVSVQCPLLESVLACHMMRSSLDCRQYSNPTDIL